CVSLGKWQLRRAAEREAIALSIEQGRKSPPLSLTPNTPHEQFQDWRQATATGTWQSQFTVLLDNRNYNGRPGFWVAMPLLIDAESNTGLLVLRGWIPRPVQPGEKLPNLSARPETTTIEGQLRQRVPRLFELYSFSGSDASALPPSIPAIAGETPRVQNLSIQDYAAGTGLKLLPVVLEQTSDDSL